MSWNNTQENSVSKYMEFMESLKTSKILSSAWQKLMELDLRYDDIDITHRLNKEVSHEKIKHENSCEKS